MDVDDDDDDDDTSLFAACGSLIDDDDNNDGGQLRISNKRGAEGECWREFGRLCEEGGEGRW